MWCGVPLRRLWCCASALVWGLCRFDIAYAVLTVVSIVSHWLGAGAVSVAHWCGRWRRMVWRGPWLLVWRAAAWVCGIWQLVWPSGLVWLGVVWPCACYLVCGAVCPCAVFGVGRRVWCKGFVALVSPVPF